MVKYKEFPFDRLFNYKRGKRLIEENQIPGNIPYISSTKENNGISNYITPPEFMIRYKNRLTLSNSGSVGYCFYHDYEFVASDHVTVLELKDFTLNKNIALFLKPILESIKYKYNFGREISDKRIKKENIYLPCDFNGNPDWDYMDKYITYLNQIVGFESINTSNKQFRKLDVTNWKVFDAIKYFDMYTGDYYPAISYTDGDTPLISASNKDNGIMAFTDLDPVFKGNCLTIGKVDMSVFYQPKDFCATSDVTVLIPKCRFNKYIGLFIKTILEQENYKWGYGRQIRLYDSQKLKVLLPSKNNEPDWELMENFIKNLSYGDRI